MILSPTTANITLQLGQQGWVPTRWTKLDLIGPTRREQSYLGNSLNTFWLLELDELKPSPEPSKLTRHHSPGLSPGGFFDTTR